MRITKVKLEEGGLNGIKVDYTTMINRSGFATDNVFPGVHFKGMVHEELIAAIRSLKNHFINIQLLDDSEDTANAVEITGISSDGETNFIITGKVRTYDNRVYGVATPLIQDGTSYPHFEEVIKIANTIYTETKAFVQNADKSGTYEQIILTHAERNGEELNISEMSATEIKERAEDILEGKGYFKTPVQNDGTIDMPEDTEVEEQDTQEGNAQEDTVNEVEKNTVLESAE